MAEKKEEVRIIEVREDEFIAIFNFVKSQPLDVALQTFGIMQQIIQRNPAQPEAENPKPNRATRRKIEKAK